MSFVKVTESLSDSEAKATPRIRPRFNHQNTVDRLREGSTRPSSFTMVSGIRKGRKSMFKEVGLDDDVDVSTLTPKADQATHDVGGEHTGLPTNEAAVQRRPSHQPEQQSRELERRLARPDNSATSPPPTPNMNKPWYSKLAGASRPKIKTASSAPPPTVSSLSRLTMIALLIAVILPAFSYYNGRQQVAMSGADAGAIPPGAGRGPILDSRQNSDSTQVCTRWSQQTALLNGTLYIYGGQATMTSGQTNNTWNNNFLTLDLTKSWQIGSPALTALPQPSGPPAVANGYLWNDYNNLYLYGGEFADNPFAEPVAMATWQYAIGSKTWNEYTAPQTSAGNATDSSNVPVQRAAEGAGVSVPELGLSWYFGGHLDLSTTPGWSNQVARVYLKSLLEFTHPGYSNNGVTSLAGGSGAGAGGVYRNITQGGLQTDSAFYERADGVLVFVPGWGAKGVLIGLAGGTNDSFTNDLSTLDVYDIANSEWYHQSTSGTAPSVRVNPCAVVASAPDASSFQIYLYGGQNLLPYGNQIQYSDMYILSIPAFTWINITQGGSNQPAARAGHTCDLRDGQMVVMGGYIGNSTGCDSPGVYVFNASSLAWQSSFTALDHPADLSPDNSVLAGSYGYTVPEAVARVIGGNDAGGATATTPAAGPATGGPFATGKSPVFTVTDSASTATITQWSPGVTGGAASAGSGSGGSSADNGSSSARPGLIAAGVIAALAGLAAAYLGYCAWLYRRQVRAYKRHLAVANRYSGPTSPRTSFGPLAALFGRKSSKGSRTGRTAGAAGGAALLSEKAAGHRRGESSSTTDTYGWVGQKPADPRWLFDDPSPSGSGPSPGYTGPYGAHHGGIGGGSGSGSAPYYGQHSGSTAAAAGAAGAAGSHHHVRSGSQSGGSSSSTENLLAGQEPSFFSVIVGPRRALRVVNGMEGETEGGGH